MRAILSMVILLVSACTFDYGSLRNGKAGDANAEDGLLPADAPSPPAPDSADVPQGSGDATKPDVGAGGGTGMGGASAAGGSAGTDGGIGSGGTVVAGGRTGAGGAAGSGGGSGASGGTLGTGGSSVGGGSGGTIVGTGGTGGMATGGRTTGTGGASGGTSGPGGARGGAPGSGGRQTGGTVGTGGSTGTGGGGGTSGCTVGLAGPSGYCWDLFHVPAASATWVAQPNPSSVHVSAQSSNDGVAGMYANLNGGAPADLSGYDQLLFDATVPSGQRFAVSIGNKSAGEYCQWELVGSGKATYTLDLRTAKLCWPNMCGLSRSAIRELSFYSAEWSTNYVLDMTLTRVELATTISGFSPTTAGYGATTGLDGWCWSLFSWSNKSTSVIGSTATWATTPDSTQVQVQVVDSDADGAAGCSAQLPAGQRDLSAATYLVFDANVTLSSATRFAIVLQDVNRAHADFDVTVSPGAQTYRVLLANPTYVGNGGGVAFDLSNVYAVDFASPWGLVASGSIAITRVTSQ